MKLMRYSLIGLLIFFSCGMQGHSTVNIGTYNILNPYHAVKWGTEEGLNDKGRVLDKQSLKDSTSDEKLWRNYSNWELRRKSIAENISLADIVCLQEVSRETIEDLLKLAEGHQLAVAAFHESTRECEEYGNAILYRSKKVRLIQPFEIKYTSESQIRSAACALFECSGKRIKVASVHLSGYNPSEADHNKKQSSKQLGYDELKTYVEQLHQDNNGVDGIVIAGDFNEDPGEEIHELYRPAFLQSQKYLSDGSREVTEPSNQRRIDWLFYKPLHSQEARLKSLDLEKKQKQASDHLMTGSEIRFI